MEVAVPFDGKKFIEKEIPRSTRSQIVPIVKNAYELVDRSLEDISFLRWVLGKRHIGYLDNIAVQFTLYEAVQKGLLNFEAQINSNVNKSSLHVELKTNNTILTINRADNKYSTARKAIFRTILQKENQLFWDIDKDELLEEPGYLQLTHNRSDDSKEVGFVNIGIPNGKGKWYSFVDLTKELHLIDGSKDSNNITREQLVKFKNFAQGVQEDGGQNRS